MHKLQSEQVQFSMHGQLSSGMSVHEFQILFILHVCVPEHPVFVVQFFVCPVVQSPHD